MKMKMKIKKDHIDTIPRSRHGYKYSKYKKCVTMMVLICILSKAKQHLKLDL